MVMIVIMKVNLLMIKNKEKEQLNSKMIKLLKALLKLMVLALEKLNIFKSIIKYQIRYFKLNMKEISRTILIWKEMGSYLLKNLDLYTLAILLVIKSKEKELLISRMVVN
jgi:hypothetical protein